MLYSSFQLMDSLEPFARIIENWWPEATLVRHWPLEGGVSAQVVGLEIQEPNGDTQHVVLRRHEKSNHTPCETSRIATEFALLGALRGAGLEVPITRFLDASGQFLPTPFMIMDWVDGSTIIPTEALPEALERMANYLGRLHTLSLKTPSLPNLPPREDPIAGTLKYLPSFPNESFLRDTLSNLGPIDDNSPSILHGDFWPGNILWRKGKIAAVIDWEDAAIGDPLSDLAGARIELLWKYGPKAMKHFTAHYLSAQTINVTNLSVWELYVASSAMAFMGQWGLDPEREHHMRNAAMAFLMQASEQLLNPRMPLS